MLIEVHMLKNYPPTCLNRDDAGSPKSCIFGGVQRGRISSQCIKRSVRTSELFTQAVGKSNIGVHTRKLPELVAKELEQRGFPETFIEEAKKKISGFGNREGRENKDGPFTAQIAFYSKQDIDSVADKVTEAIGDINNLEQFKQQSVKDWQKSMQDTNRRGISIDMALFGRMVTSDAFVDVEAAMQVAHAVSTHRVENELDFFTAVDDLIFDESDQNLRAGMLGDADFNSCCYYFYASIDLDQLKENLKNSYDAKAVAKELVPAVIETFVFSNPSGKQNAFAGNVLPEMVLCEAKSKKVPLSYINAFVKPARAGDMKDIVEDSISKFFNEVNNCDKDYALELDGRVWFAGRKYAKVSGPEKGHRADSLPALIEALRSWTEKEWEP